MIHTHTFNGVRYKIEFTDRIDGATDCDEPFVNPEMLILLGSDFRAFHAAFHEALEASGFCDACLHDSEGEPRTWDAARFLWRWLDGK